MNVIVLKVRHKENLDELAEVIRRVGLILATVDDILRSEGLAACAGTDGRKGGEDLIARSHQ